MPIYEFKCPLGHITEKIFSIAERPPYIVCLEQITTGDCLKIAERVPSVPATFYEPEGKHTIVYHNKQTGEKRVAIMRNQENPPGFEKIELRNTFERTAFEREMQQRHNIENEQVTQRNFAIKDQARKNRHADIEARMNTVEINSNENPQLTKDLLKEAMKRSSKKELPHKKTEFHLAVNHNNSNNLDKG